MRQIGVPEKYSVPGFYRRAFILRVVRTMKIRCWP
jgi:hypothetical protein